MLLRIASSSSAALVVTGALLLVMAGFLAREAGPRVPVRRAEPASFVFEPPPPPVIVRRRPPPPPAEPHSPPPRTQTGAGDTDIPVVFSGPGRISPPSGPTNLSPGIADGDLLPVVTIAPTYPPAAERRDLEGYVIVAFMVTTSGSVRNVYVVESTHSVFERAAVEAAERFRFRPRIIDGRPVDVADARRRITFTLEN